MNEYDSLVEKPALEFNEYADLIPDPKQELKQSMFVASKADPDVKARNIKLADEMNLPVDFVDRNYDALVEKKTYAKSDSEYDKLINENPKLAAYLKDPNNASVSKDDISSLSALESSVGDHGFWSQAYNSMMVGFSSFNSGLAKAPAFIGNLSLIPSNIVRKSLDMPEVGYSYQNTLSDRYDAAATEFAKGAPLASESVVNTAMSGDYAKAGKVAALNVIQSAPQQIGFIMSAMAGLPAVGLAQAGVTTGAQKASELEKQGVGPLQATAVGATHGSIEAAFESIGTMGILKQWEGAIARQGGKQLSREVVFDFAKTLGHSFLAEGNEEALTSFAQDFTDYVTGVNPDAMKGSVQRMIDAGIIGGISGVAMTSPGGAMMGLQRQAQARQATLNKNTFLAMGENAKESKLRERLPEKYKEYVDHVTKDGPVSEVYLPINGMETYFQSQGKNPTQAAQELGFLKEYTEAKETGADIKVPMSTMVTNVVDTEYFQGISDHIKYHPDEMTVAEAIQARKEISDVAAETQKKADDIESQAKRVGNDITEQLMATGVKQKDARVQAAVYEAVFRTLGVRTNQSPEELYKQYGLKIRGGEQLSADGQTVMNQLPSGTYDADTGDYKLGSVEANVQVRSSDNLDELAPGLSDVVGGEALEINTLEVPKDKQGGGLGSSALADIERVAADNGQTHIVLKAEPLSSPLVGEADPQNLGKLIKFYEKNGYSVFKKNKTNAIMFKNLDTVMAEAAAALGFDTSKKYYTGTKFNFDSFNVPMDGVRTLGAGVYLAENKKLPDAYAGKDGKIITAYVRGTDKIVSADKKLTKKDISKIERVIDADVLSAMNSDNDIEVGSTYANFFRRLQLRTNEVNSMDNKSIGNQAIAVAEALGITGLSNGDRETMIFDPKNVKDINAAFNEAESGKIYSQQGPRGQIRFGKDRQFNIDLLAGADKSTFLHETGHFMFEVFADLATAEGANEQIKADYKALLDWYGVESRDQIKTEHHEKFARGFEQYLMTGKAPTSALRKAFNTFKTWLTEIYRQIKGSDLDVNLTPEVTEILDRMLATDEELDAAQNKMGGPRMFGDPRSAGLTEEQTYDYLNAAEFARMDANEQLSAELMKDLIKKQDKKYKETYDRLYAENMDKAKLMPEFKAIAQIQGEMKLSKQVIDKSYSVFKDTLPFRSTKAEGGLHPDFVADMLGFENGQAMLQAIAPYRRGIEDFVHREVATEMRVQYPELLTSPELSAEALKAAHNDQARRVKRMELDHLAKESPRVLKNVAGALIKRLPSDRAVKEQAANIIGSKKVSEIKPYIFLAAEKKYSKEAAKAYLKGDFEAAFEAKRLEYLNFELYLSSQKASEDVKKQLKNFKRLFRADEDLAKNRDVDLVNAARAILADYGITKSEKTAAEYLEKTRQYDPETYSVLSAIISGVQETAGLYTDVSYDVFKDMSDVVTALWDRAKESKEIEIRGQKLNTDAVKKEMTDHINQVSGGALPPGYSQKVSQLEKVKIGLLGMKSALRRVESWADAIDGDKDIFKKYMFEPISEAASQYRIDKKNYILKYLDLVKTVRSELTQDKIHAEDIGYTFSGKAELLGALLHTGNESNLRKLLVGRKWGSINEDGSLNRSRWDSMIYKMQVDGTLTKADFDFAQGVWDLLEELKPQAQKAHKKMYGFYFNEITATPFSTTYGEYSGGYVPAVADQYMAQDAAIRAEKEQLENMGNSFMFPTTGRGFTKSRVDAYAAPLSIDLAFVGGHIDKVLRFINIEPRVKEVSRIIMDKGFRSELDALDPTIGGDMLVPWLQRAAQQKISLTTQGRGGKALDTVFRELRSRASLQIMTLNVVNAMQQFTGLSVAATKVAPKYLRNSLWGFVKNPKGVANDVSEKSQFMSTRNTTSIMEIQNEIDDMLLNPTKYEQITDYARKHSQALAAMTQNVVDNVTWSAAYDQAVSNGVSEAQAVRDADAAVRLTQGSFNAEDVSRFETGTPFVRAFTMFYSYFNMLANLLGTEFEKVRKGLGFRKGAGRIAYVYTMAFMVPAVLSEVIMRAMSGSGFDEDDDDNYLDDAMSIFFGSQFRTATAMIPGVGQVANTAVNYFNDKPYDDRISSSPAISLLESSVKAPYDVYKSIAENGSKKAAVKDSLTLIGMTMGVPAGVAGKPLGYLIDQAEGKIEPATGPIDFTRGLITGKGDRR